MSNAKKRAPSLLQSMPFVGPKIEAKLARLGIKEPHDLVQRDPDEMIFALNEMDGYKHDPCLRDLFEAIIEYSRTGKCENWWYYSRIRKAKGEREK